VALTLTVIIVICLLVLLFRRFLFDVILVLLHKLRTLGCLDLTRLGEGLVRIMRRR